MANPNPRINLEISNNTNAIIRLGGAQLAYGKFTVNGDPNTNLPAGNLNGQAIPVNLGYYVYAYGLQGQDGSVQGSIDVYNNNGIVRICTISWNNPFAVGNNAFAINNQDPNFIVLHPNFPAQGPLGTIKVTIADGP